MKATDRKRTVTTLLGSVGACQGLLGDVYEIISATNDDQTPNFDALSTMESSVRFDIASLNCVVKNL